MEQGGETETSGVELRTLSTISTFSTPRHMISEHASTVISNMAASVITRPNLKFLLHKNKRTAETGLYVSNRKTVIRRGRIVDLGERSYCFGSVKQKKCNNSQTVCRGKTKADLRGSAPPPRWLSFHTGSPRRTIQWEQKLITSNKRKAARTLLFSQNRVSGVYTIIMSEARNVFCHRFQVRAPPVAAILLFGDKCLYDCPHFGIIIETCLNYRGKIQIASD